MKKTWMSRAVAVLAVLAMQFSWGGGLLPQADGGADANRLSPIGPNPFADVPTGAYTPPATSGPWEFGLFKVADAGVTHLNVDSYQADWKFLYDAASFSGYSFQYSEILISDLHAAKVGTSLKLHAPYSGVATIKTTVDVKGLKDEGTAYVRLTKNGVSLMDTDSGWISRVKADVGGEVGNIPLPDLSVSLCEGDVLALETYAEGQKDIQFILKQYNVSRSVAFPDEEPDVLSPLGPNPYAGQTSGSWTKPTVSGLWEYDLLTAVSGDEPGTFAATPFPCNYYEDTWSFLYDQTTWTGYNFESPDYLLASRLQSDADKTHNTGISLKLNNPMNGVAEIETALEVKELSEGDTFYVRVTKNGKSLLSTASGWQAFTPADLTGKMAALPKMATILGEGDILRLEAFVQAAGEVDLVIGKFNVTKAVQFPHQTADTLSPMGPNPLGDAASGAYAQPVPSDIWRYQTLELTADGKETIADCNQYVKEWGNYLYNGANSAGYHFNSQNSFDAELKKSQAGYAGLSLNLISPVKRRMKVSAVIGVGTIPEKSALYVRIRKNDVSQVPDETGWFVFRQGDVAQEAVTLPELELAAAQGDEIRLDIYMAGEDMSDSVGITLYQYNLTRIPDMADPGEEPDSVTPVGKNPQKGQPAGAYTPPNPPGEWTYRVLSAADGTAIDCDFYNESWGNYLFHNATYAGYHLNDGAIGTESHKTADGIYGVSLQLNSPLSGRLKTQLSMGTGTVPCGTAMYVRLTRNSDTVYPSAGGWAKVGSKQLNATGDIDLRISSLVFEAAKGDEIRLEYYFDGEDVPDKVETAIFSYTLSKTDDAIRGEPDPDPDPEPGSDPEPDPGPEPDSVTPVGLNPMGSAGDGAYTPPNPPGRWEYQILEAKQGDGGWLFNTLDCNYYMKTWGQYLHLSGANAGYHFDPAGINFENHVTNGTNYGMSLNLNSPMEGLVKLKLSMGTDAIPREAALHLRITKNSETVYPAGGGWAIAGSKQLNAQAGIDFTLSKLVFDIAKGDDVRLEFFLEGKELPATVMSTLFEYSLTKTTEPVTGDDLPDPDPEPEGEPETDEPVPVIGANARFTSYTALLGHPLKGLEASYSGEYQPEEGTWNFELLDVADNMRVYTPDYITMGWDSYLYSRSTNAGYHIRKAGVSAELKEIDGKSYGVSLRLVSQLTGTASLTTAAGLNSGKGTVHARILKNGEQLWPAEGWATGAGVGIPILSLNLEKGDEICLQAYGSGLETGSVTVDLGTPSLTVVDNIDTEKTLFSMSTDFLAGLNLDPYWSYEYSLDNVNPTFKKLELYDTGWSYHLASGARYIGCGAEGYLWVSNEKGDIQVPENKYGIVAAAWTSMKDGYVKLRKREVGLHGYSNDDMRLRITLNGEKVWPADGDWAYLRADQKVVIGEEIFQVAKGDVLRFEATMVENAGDNHGGYAIWDPSLVFSLTKPDAGGSGDNSPSASDLLNIFYGLSEEDIARYQRYESLGDTAQFDDGYAENKLLADKMANREPDADVEEPPIDYNDPEEEGPAEPGEPPLEPPESPESSEPGDVNSSIPEETTQQKKKTVVQRRVVTVGLPPAAVVGIAVGAVVLAGGVVALIILKKRGILRFKKGTGEGRHS